MVATWLLGKCFLEQLWILEDKFFTSVSLMILLLGFLVAMFWLVAYVTDIQK